MANDLSGNVWIIDTASANPVYGTSATPATQRACVSGITFSGYSDAAHQAIVQDDNGIVVTLDGETGLTAQHWAPAEPVWLTGLKVTTLGSGKVSIAVV